MPADSGSIPASLFPSTALVPIQLFSRLSGYYALTCPESAGSVNMKFDPCPSRLSTQMQPP